MSNTVVGLESLSDVDLLDRARSGDQTAASAFARRHTEWAIGLAWRFGARDDSEDIVQYLLARLLTGDTHPVLRSASARPYMHAAILRRANTIAELRSRNVGHPGDHLPADQTSITGRLARAEEHRQLAASIAALPDYQRQVVELRAEGLDHDEIAEIIGRKPGVVRTYLSRAIQSLRRARSV
jgi:RNA polymerase sigma factor (sigma-70 family)